MNDRRKWWSTKARQHSQQAELLRFLETALGDARYALRRLGKRLGFTSIAVLTLALGIGVNTTMFGVLRATVLQPLAHPRPEQLVMVEEIWSPTDIGNTSWPTFQALRKQLHSLAELVATEQSSINVQSSINPQRVRMLTVTANYFQALGGSPWLGRFFVDGDDAPGAPRITVLTYQLWMESFGADPGIVGRSFMLDGESYSVVGIAPANFRSDPFPGVKLWRPMQPIGPIFNEYGAVALDAFGRLKAGETELSANAELTVAMQNIRRTAPSFRKDLIGESARAVSMHRWETHDLSLRLSLLTAAFFLFLVIAVTNVANLLLVGTLSRKREFSTRMALGASKSRLAQQAFVESLVLATAGALAGVVAAEIVMFTLRRAAAVFLPYGTVLRLDVSTLFYGAGLSILTAVVFGIAPVLFVTRGQNIELRTSRRGSGTSSGQLRAS